jgi:GNAT superfamily N-acetyltransferase
MYNCDFQARLAEACPAFQIPGGHELCPPPRCWSFKLIDQECAMSDASRFERSTRLNVLRLPGGQAVMVRAISPQDADCLQAYIRNLSAPARRNRFLGALSELAPRELNRLTHMNGPQKLALVVFARTGGETAMIGEAVQVIAPESRRCEIALSVADAWQRKGLGTILLSHMKCRARMTGVRHVIGEILRTNEAMRGLAHKAGFAIRSSLTDARLVEVVKDLSTLRTGLPCHEQFFAG